MKDRPQIETTAHRFRMALFFQALVILIVVVVVHPIIPIAAYLIRRWLYYRYRHEIWFLAILGIVWTVYRQPFLQWMEQGNVIGSILAIAPIIPVAASSGTLYKRTVMFIKQPNLSEFADSEGKRIDAYHEGLYGKADAHKRRMPAVEPGVLRLGTIIKGDSFPVNSGIQQVGNWVCLHDAIINQHLFVLGGTGSGKTENLKRLIYEQAYNTQRNIYLVDGKAEEDLAQTVRAICHDTDRGNTPIFRYGSGKAGASYNGFNGDQEAIYNRLSAMIGIGEATSGEGRSYEEFNRNVIQLVCYAPEGPPRSFQELRKRVSMSWVTKTWGNDDDEAETLKRLKDNKRAWAGLLDRISSLARPLKQVVDPDGFSLDNSRSAIFSLNALSAGDTALRLFEFLLEDVADFISNRKDPNEDALLVVDEFGVIPASTMAKLLKLARGKRMGIVIATQNTASLGDEQMSEEILSDTITTMLLNTKFPEKIVETAGTKWQVEGSLQHEEGALTGMGSARFQHAFKIDPNEVRQLPSGKGFVFRYGRQSKVSFAMLGQDEIPTNTPPEVIPQQERKQQSPDEQKKAIELPEAMNTNRKQKRQKKG